MAECDNNIPEYIILPSEGVGIEGPAGPPGPQGPPGIGELPVPADDVSVTNDGYNTAQEIFDALLYVPIAISSFSPNTSVYEIGVVITALGFTWTYNKSPIVSQTLTGPHDAIVLGISERAATVNFTPNLGATSNFTLQVNDGVNSVQSVKSVQFINGVYYGDAPAGAVDSAFLLTLNKTLQTGLNKTFSSSAGVDVYAWYAHRKSLGVATFTVGGFEGGFNAPTTLSFTNASGFTEDYYVYRSTNPEIGPVNIVVS